jgi:hypothetical protein
MSRGGYVDAFALGAKNSFAQSEFVGSGRVVSREKPAVPWPSALNKICPRFVVFTPVRLWT